MSSDGWVPTARLRFVNRPVQFMETDLASGTQQSMTRNERRLQQWWAPDVPRYMITDTVGEWRDVIEVGGEP